MDDTREDPSRAPLLVFFPVKPRSHYMVSGRVERYGTPGRRGSLDQHNLTWGEVGVVSVSLKFTSSDLNRCPTKRNIIKRKKFSEKSVIEDLPVVRSVCFHTGDKTHKSGVYANSVIS
jgi:hypothetical protein